MTEGFGRKWKDFFYTLEDHHGLDVSDPSHIWLLHLLFLPAINEDALAWAEAWNSHRIQLEGERRKSPRQMFAQSGLLDGIRGLPPTGSDEAVDYDSYGVDWEAVEELRSIAAQNEDANRNGDADAGSGVAHPNSMNHVVCESPSCPLTDEQLQTLMGALAPSVNVAPTGMNGRRVVWVSALELLLGIIA